MTKARDIASASPAPSTVSATELGYLDGVSSAIQTQIDSKIGSASAISPTLIDAKGDLIVGSAADTAARLAVGTNDYVLTADSSATNGVKWAAPASGATYVGCLAYRSTSLSVSYNVWTTVTLDSESNDSDGFHSTTTNTERITIPSGKGGKYLVNAAVLWDQTTSASGQIRIRLNNTSSVAVAIVGHGGYNTANLSQIVSLSAGDYIHMEAYTDVSGGNTLQTYSPNAPLLQVIYLGA